MLEYLMMKCFVSHSKNKQTFVNLILIYLLIVIYLFTKKDFIYIF